MLTGERLLCKLTPDPLVGLTAESSGIENVFVDELLFPLFANVCFEAVEKFVEFS